MSPDLCSKANSGAPDSINNESKYWNTSPKSTPIPWFNKHSDTSKKQTALQESESTNYVIGVMSEGIDYNALPAL